MGRKPNPVPDLVGQKFGMLEVIEYVKRNKAHRTNIWRCRCECDNIIDISERSLKDTNTVSSCGCYQKQFLIPGNSELTRKAGKARAASNPDGINMAMLNMTDTICTNTSGCTGVSWSTTAHKYHVYVGYKKYRCNLGYIENYDDAVALRQKAVDAIRQRTFEEFFYELRGFRIEEKLNKITK